MPSDLDLPLEERLSAGRLMAVQNIPYLEAAVYSLRYIPRPGLTAAIKSTTGFHVEAITDKYGRMQYDPESLSTRGTEHLAWVVLHEGLHLVLDHSDLQEISGWDPLKANIAFDAAINDDIERMGITVPSEAIMPCMINGGMPDGELESTYYNAILDKPAQDSITPKPSKSPFGKGEDESQQGDSDDSDDGEEDGEGSGSSEEQNRHMPMCGTCAGHGPLGGDESEGDADGEEDGDGDAMDLNLAAMRMTVARDVESHKSVGNVPNSLLVWSEKMLKAPQVTWQDLFRNALSTAAEYVMGDVEPNFARPSRRQCILGWEPGTPIMPSYQTPVPIICFVHDTSASMGDEENTLGVTEAASILDTVDAIVTFGTCDCSMSDDGIKEVKSLAEIASMMKGGGGTSFYPIFEAVEKMAQRPNILIISTDGGGPAPAEPPQGIVVIWLIVGENTSIPANYGTVIEIKANK